MALHLTPLMLERAYLYLASSPPFLRWRLPEADEIEFHVTCDNGVYADYSCPEGQHRIRLSAEKCGHTHTLMAAMAHEMVHLRQNLMRGWKNVTHGDEFKRLGALVCKHHGFDPRAF